MVGNGALDGITQDCDEAHVRELLINPRRNRALVITPSRRAAAAGAPTGLAPRVLRAGRKDVGEKLDDRPHRHVQARLALGEGTSASAERLAAASVAQQLLQGVR